MKHILHLNFSLCCLFLLTNTSIYTFQLSSYILLHMWYFTFSVANFVLTNDTTFHSCITKGLLLLTTYPVWSQKVMHTLFSLRKYKTHWNCQEFLCIFISQVNTSVGMFEFLIQTGFCSDQHLYNKLKLFLFLPFRSVNRVSTVLSYSLAMSYFFILRSILIKYQNLYDFTYATLTAVSFNTFSIQCLVTLYQSFRILFTRPFPVRNIIWTWIQFSTVKWAMDIWNSIWFKQTYLNVMRNKINV
jgi:hypothetical protein